MKGPLPSLLALPQNLPTKRAPQRQDGLHGEPLSPLNLMSVDTLTDPNAIVDYAVSSLEEMQPKLVRTIAAAMRLQLDTLKTGLEKLRDEDGDIACEYENAAPITSGATELATAISESLGPRFDTLERDAADLANQIPLTARQPDFLDQMNSPAVAASVLDELLPQLTGPVAATIENIMTARLSNLGEEADDRQNGAGKSNRSNANLRVQIEDDRSGCNSGVYSAGDSKDYQTPGGSVSDATQLSLPIELIGRTVTSTSMQAITTRHSDIEKNHQPERAFVVNFRRLVAVHKLLSLIHLFIKSTAIATLTLVSSAYWTDLVFSVAFVSSVLGIYAIHEIRHDGMDIEDYKSLGSLLEDDNGLYTNPNGEESNVSNPNRLLKALTLSQNSSRRRRSLISIVISVLLVLIIWLNVFWSWTAPEPANGLWLGVFNKDDIAVMATQMLIGTVMLLFHGIFEWLYWRETQCVMPWDEESDKPWDPRSTAKRGRGVPLSHSWFGLPSMWFTSWDAYHDVRLWITLATSKHPATHIVTKIFPEEMALFALDPDNACDLNKTLKHAKLFSLADWQYKTRCYESADGVERQSASSPLHHSIRNIEAWEAPDELEVALALYDSATGQFLEPHHHKEYRSSLVQLLASSRSQSRSHSRLNFGHASRHQDDRWSPACSPKSLGMRLPAAPRSECATKEFGILRSCIV